jgi:sugar lactone lactonase YvrE
MRSRACCRSSPGQGARCWPTGVGGDPIRYADAVVVARDGKIYFTDASTRFGPVDWGGTFEASVLDILEQSATGRVLGARPGQPRGARGGPRA